VQLVGVGEQPDRHHVVHAVRGREHDIQKTVEQLFRYFGIPVRAHRGRCFLTRTPSGHVDKSELLGHRHTHR